MKLDPSLIVGVLGCEVKSTKFSSCIYLKASNSSLLSKDTLLPLINYFLKQYNIKYKL